jgi:tRNA threonylcarbamoyladenosine biosynthesis protein TsaB
MSDLLLAIDTCGAAGSIALAALGESLTILGEKDLPGKSYSAQLIPAIRALLAAHRPSSGPLHSVAALRAIVVTSGPGSFTGIRIGLSAAKGLAEAAGVPILAVSRLAVLARNAGCEAAALDARRHEFYLGDYRNSSPLEALLTAEAFAAKAGPMLERLAVCEDSAHQACRGATLVTPPRAADAVHFALPRLRSSDFTDPVTLDGNYLRRSDAEIFAGTKLLPAAQP